MKKKKFTIGQLVRVNPLNKVRATYEGKYYRRIQREKDVSFHFQKDEVVLARVTSEGY